MKPFLYADYGSNLHPDRLRAADRCPSAKLIGTCVIAGRLLTFRKRSDDGSVKCDADRTGQQSDELRLAVFIIPKSQENALDGAEGLNKGYNAHQIQVPMGGKNLIAKIYLADQNAIVTDTPYEWYKQMVLLGAEYHSFPTSYTESIRNVVSKPDLDASRSQRKWEEVEQLRAANNRLQWIGGLRRFFSVIACFLRLCVFRARS